MRLIGKVPFKRKRRALIFCWLRIDVDLTQQMKPSPSRDIFAMSVLERGTASIDITEVLQEFSVETSHGRTDKWTDERTEEWMFGWVDGWMG